MDRETEAGGASGSRRRERHAPGSGGRALLPARPRLRLQRRRHHDLRGRLRCRRSTAPARIILILGFANLVADGFSMGASNFLARRSYAEARDRADRPTAAKHGVATLVGFLSAGMIPLAAYLAPIPDDVQFLAAVALTAGTLFAVGASRSLVTRLGWFRSGAEMLAVGAAAAAVAYAIGAVAAALTG